MKKIGLFCVLFALMLIGHSCIEEQDFGQYDDLSVIPKFESSIIYIEATEEVINLAPNTTFYSQEFDFNPFSESVFADRVVDGVITYELENTTSKDLDIKLEFLDESGVILDTEIFSPIYKAPSAVLKREVVYGNTGESLDIIINTSKIRVTANNLSDNSSVSTQPEPLIVLKSSGKFSVRVK
ncbi:hypothetical protein [Maribacter sp.]|uniref:hypothetical protein n=1 Tax=Maribacter sp. TaxID=1897614 RepID=UPI0025C27A4A|nr:hypothetical protein [Maribacter sp.]